MYPVRFLRRDADEREAKNEEVYYTVLKETNPQQDTAFMQQTYSIL
jgi:hypothetical protein